MAKELSVIGGIREKAGDWQLSSGLTELIARSQKLSEEILKAEIEIQSLESAASALDEISALDREKASQDENNEEAATANNVFDANAWLQVSQLKRRDSRNESLYQIRIDTQETGLSVVDADAVGRAPRAHMLPHFGRDQRRRAGGS